MPEFEDVVVGGNNTARPGQSPATVNDSITSDGRHAPLSRGRSSIADKAATGPLSEVNDPLPSSKVGSGRALPESVRSKIEAIIKETRPTVEDDPDEPDDIDVAPKDATAVDDEPDEPDDEAKPADGVSTSPPEWEAERAKLQSERDEHKAAAEKYRAEAEAAKKANPNAERLKRLDEAEDTYVRSPVDAFKQWLAATNGYESTSPDFEKELTDFYIDLTAHLTGAQPDPNHQSNRSSALIRREWDRDKKKRAADEQKQTEQAAPSEQADPDDYTGYVPLVTELFKPVASKFPDLVRFAKAFDRRSAEDVLAEVVHKGFKENRFKNTDKDDAILEQAAKLANDYYIRRRDEILGTPSPATKPDAGKAPAADAQVQTDKQRQPKGSRVTNADASAAPTAPPANKPSEPVKRTFKDDDERKRYITRKHLGTR